MQNDDRIYAEWPLRRPRTYGRLWARFWQHVWRRRRAEATKAWTAYITAVDGVRDSLNATCEWCGAGPHSCDCHARIHCREAGQFGHQQCGICPAHRKPRFVCGCLGRP